MLTVGYNDISCNGKRIHKVCLYGNEPKTNFLTNVLLSDKRLRKCLVLFIPTLGLKSTYIHTAIALHSISSVNIVDNQEEDIFFFFTT